MGQCFLCKKRNQVEAEEKVEVGGNKFQVGLSAVDKALIAEKKVRAAPALVISASQIYRRRRLSEVLEECTEVSELKVQGHFFPRVQLQFHGQHALRELCEFLVRVFVSVSLYMADISTLPDLDTEDLFFLAKAAEQSERFEGMIPLDMVHFMQVFIRKISRELRSEERIALSVAYKNVIGVRRASWRVLISIEHKESQRNNRANSQRAAKYRAELETELSQLCTDILSLIDLLIARESTQYTAFYCKMKGDYCRYLCEFGSEERRTWLQRAVDAYEIGIQAARGLQAFDPIRLGIALNFAVLKYEIMGDTPTACELVKVARAEALEELKRTEAPSRDTGRLLQLMGDNLSLWTCESAGED